MKNVKKIFFKMQKMKNVHFSSFDFDTPIFGSFVQHRLKIQTINDNNDDDNDDDDIYNICNMCTS